MKRPLFTTLCVLVCLALLATTAFARNVNTPTTERYVSKAKPNQFLGNENLNSTAVQGTTMLGFWDFDSGPACDEQGWTHADLTEQVGDFTHVDDFAGLGGGTFGLLNALEGSQSLWIGARPDGASLILCGYATLPGYGNGWDQAFCSSCLAVSGDVTLAYKVAWDSEPGYDMTVVEYDNCDDNWQTISAINGGVGFYDNTGTLDLDAATVVDSLHSGSIRLRFHFTADGAWSDSDGLWDTDGAIIVDSLSVTDGTGVINSENFESEAVGDNGTASGVWNSCPPPGYGDFAALYSGITVLQEDPCYSELSCVWTFYTGSTESYACGGFPGTTAVPKGNSIGQYISNEVWSPYIPFVGAGSSVKFRVLTYRDLPLDNLVFYIWRVRSIIGGCPGDWRRDNTSYFGPEKDWLQDDWEAGQLIEAGASDIQFGIGVVDRCPIWCGVFGTGACHSQAPMFDKFQVLRVNVVGPTYEQQGWDVFQDNFAQDGTTTGTVRIDSANDILPGANPNVVPGDSAAVRVSDPGNGLASDAYTGFGAAVYAYVGIWPQNQPGKNGSSISDDTFRWPVVDSVTSPDGSKWYCVRLDTAFAMPGRAGAAADEFCFDLNDNLFTPGDTICYFWCAESDDGLGSRSYFHGGYNHLDNFDAVGAVLTTNDINEAFANAMEVTCLPANGLSGGDILYVDDGDGRSGQPFFDTAFQALGLEGLVDRYDVEAPSSNVGNGPGNRVKDVFTQIIPIYRKIIWNSEELTNGTIGDGTVDKSLDFTMLFTYLDQSTDDPGLYVSGDGVIGEWNGLTSADALNLRGAYMNYTLVTSDHKTVGLGITPLSIGQTGSCFDGITGPDTLVAYGGCAAINRFDVLAPAGPSVLEMAYDDNPSYGSILSQTTPNSAGGTARVMIAGFDFANIRDDRAGANGGVADRIWHLYQIITWLQNTPQVPVDVPDRTAYEYKLDQNYPNPFNPTTTIKYELKDTGNVSLKVYNVAGQLVRTLVNERQDAGVGTIEWNGRNDAGQLVSSGVYFYKLVTNNFVQTKKMVLLK